jgi:hypothetical protein
MLTIVHGEWHARTTSQAARSDDASAWLLNHDSRHPTDENLFEED